MVIVFILGVFMPGSGSAKGWPGSPLAQNAGRSPLLASSVLVCAAHRIAWSSAHRDRASTVSFSGVASRQVECFNDDEGPMPATRV